MLEALGEELVDDAVLAAEAAVEAHGGAAGLGGDAPHAERGRPLGREQLARGLEDAPSLVVCVRLILPSVSLMEHLCACLVGRCLTSL